MRQKILTPQIWNALATAGKRAFVFTPIFLVVLTATIFMVGGDGSAPGITHLSAFIIGITVRLLGVPDTGAVIPVVLFWSLAVFVSIFLYTALLRKRSPLTDKATIGTKYWAIGSLVAFLAATLSLVKSHHNENAAVDEKRLVLEFVKQNSAVLREVGGNARIDLVSYRKSGNGSVIFYDISVQGTKTVYAIVNVSRESGQPVFSLACTTPLYMGKRDAYKHPCDQ